MRDELHIKQNSLILTFLVFLIGFNIWHATKRGIWNPPSIINSLHMADKTANFFKPFDQHLRASTYQYDGQYIYGMTYDPLLVSRRYVSILEFPKYRYQRMLYPLLANMIAFDYPPLFPAVLFCLNIIFYLAGGYVVWQLVRLNQWTPWLMVGYFSNTGLLFSVFGTLTEPLGFTLGLFGLLLWLKEFRYQASLVFALTILSRETYVVIPVAIILWSYVEKHIAFKDTLRYMAIAIVPFFSWYCYISWRLPQQNTFQMLSWMPPSSGIGHFSLPFLAMWQETIYGLTHIATTRSVFKLTLSISVVTTFSVLISSIGFIQKQNLWSWLAITQGLFAVMLRGDLWDYHMGSARVVIPFSFFFMAWCADKLQEEKSSAQV